MFADIATIEVRAGKGGGGRLSFRHEKYRAMGGPDGGDGGRGGDIIFQVDHNSNTLSAYRNAKLVKAQAGEAGGSNRMHGKNGDSVILKMPQGTQVWDGDQLVIDLAAPDQESVVARGGRGGFGNAHFKSSTRQTPRTAELGEPGDAHTFKLELKLVADVGLIGLPNAGKSTLLSVISNAKPEIADYPFTTLTPNLGVVDLDDFGFLVADIPGLIEGASDGKGLGDEFLRHVTRTAVLLHLIDAGSKSPGDDYRVIQAELEQYGHGLAEKPQILILSKRETVEEATLAKATNAVHKIAPKIPLFTISAQTHFGLTEVLRAAVTLVKQARAQAEAESAESALPVIDAAAMPHLWQVSQEASGLFRISGTRLEGFARRTNFDQPDAVARLRDILRKTGVARELRRQGAAEGDIVKIGDQELAWIE